MQCPKKGCPDLRSNARDRAKVILALSDATDRNFTLYKKERASVDFNSINQAALAALPAVLGRILPSGKIDGQEYVALNPTRGDHRPGSFKIRLSGSRAGAWSDFATGDRGGDPVSLVAYLENCPQVEAAWRLARMLGMVCEMRR
jgi:hypothetical protein